MDLQKNYYVNEYKLFKIQDFISLDSLIIDSSSNE